MDCLWSLRLVELPEILNIPKKLLPIITEFNRYRFFLLEGGRSSAKTQSVARLLTYLAEQKMLRIVCGREIQKSVDESVYTVFNDLIKTNSLDFEVLNSEINHRRTGSSLRFRGFREQGLTNIKGLEGVDILWVDEAQAITKPTLDVIIPTIRKENAKIFFTMNRYVEDDPVYVDMICRKDCLHIKINYFENEFCPQAMMLEATACRQKSAADYDYIWLGNPLKKGDDYLFASEDVKKCMGLTMDKGSERHRIMGVDIARFGGDEIVYTILESRGPVMWEVIHMEAHKNKALNETTGKIIDMVREFNLDAVVTDDTGMGGGVTDFLAETKLNVFPFNGADATENQNLLNARAAGYYRLADYVANGWIKLPQNQRLYDQLLTIRYKYKGDGKKMILSKDDMRKEGLESPDQADSVMMALYFADRAIEGKRLPGYSLHDEDLYHGGAELPRWST